MNTNFNLQRIGLLLRKDWIEHKKGLLFIVLITVGTLLLLYFTAGYNNKVFHPFSFYVFGLLATLIGFCRYVNRIIHHAKGIYLALPASNPEKYAAILIEGVLFFLTFQVLFWTALGIGSLFVTIQPISFHDIAVNWKQFSFLSLITSLIFLSYVTFRKYALGVVIGGFLAFIGLLTGSSYLLIKSGWGMEAVTKFFQNLSDMNPAATQFALNSFISLIYISTLAIMYIAYLKLKRKEQR